MNNEFIKKYGIWLILFTIFSLIEILAVFKAPRVKIPHSIEITPVNDEIYIGYKELAQREKHNSADVIHLKIRRSNNLWYFSNVSYNKKVVLKTDEGESIFCKRWLLEKGDIIKINNSKLIIDHINSSKYLTLSDISNNQKRQVTWNNGYLKPENNVFLYKHAQPLKWRVSHYFKWLIRNLNKKQRQKELVLFSIGGSVNTPDRWSIDHLLPKSAYIVWYKNNFYLKPGNNDVFIQMSRKGGKEFKDFSQKELAVDSKNISQIIIGRTYYKIEFLEKSICFFPKKNIDVWFDHENLPQNSKEIKIVYNQEKKWVGAGSISFLEFLIKYKWYLIFISFFCILCSWLLRLFVSYFDYIKYAVIIIPCFFMSGLTLIIMLKKNILLDTSLSFLLFYALLSWAWSTFWLIKEDKLNGLNKNIWICALILAGFGAFTLTQLSIGSDNIRWLDISKKHLLTLAFFGSLFPVALTFPEKLIGNFFVLDNAGFKFIRILAASLVLLILIVQMFAGNEQGLSFFQPSEIAKLLIIIMGATTGMHLTELRFYESDTFLKNPIMVIWSFVNSLVFILAIVLFVFLSVKDISPIVITFIFLLCWLWKVSKHPDMETMSKIEISIRAIIIILCTIIICIALYIYISPDNLPDRIPQKDRIKVWSDPLKHPHSGDQIIKSIIASKEGGCFGAVRSWFGLNHAAMKIPMIQNDFIGAFVLYKFGAVAALFLLGVQLFYLKCIFEKAQILEKDKLKQDFTIRPASSINSLILYGFFWIQSVQWLISWSNVLGLLPVMGQPMTWISQANSHMLFFAMPCLAFSLLLKN